MKILIYLLILTNFLFASNHIINQNEEYFEKEIGKYNWPLIILSDSEQKWIDKKHVPRVRVGNWPPYAYWQDNKPKGIAVDYINQISKKIGFKVEFKKKNYPFSEATMLLIKQKELDVIPLITDTEQRRKNILFTKDYIVDRWVIITKTNERYVGELSDLNGKTLAVTKGYTYNDTLKNKYPNIKTKEYNTDEEAILAVSIGQTDAYIGIVAASTYMIQKFNIANLKIASPAGLEPDKNSFGIRKDWPELVSILNKGLIAMPFPVKNLIKQKSLSIDYNVGISKKKVWISSLVIFAVVLITILFMYNSNKQLKELINSSIEAIVITKNGKLIDANDTLIKMQGYNSIEDLRGRDLFEFVDKSEYAKLRKNLLLDNTTYELNILNKEGKKIPALVKGTNIGNNKRISSFIDLSEYKKMQNDLKVLNNTLEKEVKKQVIENRKKDRLLYQQSKLASMGEMINNIAHQWRQPLAGINSIIMVMDSTLIKENINNDRLNDSLNEIELQTRFMSDTIENFKNFFQPEKEKKEFLLSHAIYKTFEIIKINLDRKNIQVDVEIKNDKNIEGYIGELIQVLITILNNSEDAFKESKQKKAKIVVKIDNNITIKDNAGGIKEDQIDKIFEPYYTTKHPNQGTGVGLYMAKMIIENSMNGTLNAKNVKDGAKFTITI